MAKQIGEMMVHLSGLFFRKTLKVAAYETPSFVALVHDGHELLRLTGDEQRAFIEGASFPCALGTVTITEKERAKSADPVDELMKDLLRATPFRA